MSQFNPGDRVTCSFIPLGEQAWVTQVIRRIDAITDDGFVSADAGEPCPHCGHRALAIPLIESRFFIRVAE